MAFSPIALTIPNYRDFKNYWIKAYVPSTTTPKVMASDKTGSPTVAKFELNTEGFPKTSGGALITPYIDGLYDLWLFPTEAEADANDTSNALRLAINVAADAAATDTAIAIDDAFDRLNPDTLAIWQNDALAMAGDVATTKERSTGNGGGATGDVIVGTGTANGFNIIAHNTLSLSWILREGDILNVREWGAVGDSTTDDTLPIQAALNFKSPGFVSTPFTKTNVNAVLFPRGHYRITSQIHQPSGCQVTGLAPPSLQGLTDLDLTMSQTSKIIVDFPYEITDSPALGDQWTKKSAWLITGWSLDLAATGVPVGQLVDPYLHNMAGGVFDAGGFTRSFFCSIKGLAFYTNKNVACAVGVGGHPNLELEITSHGFLFGSCTQSAWGSDYKLRGENYHCGMIATTINATALNSYLNKISTVPSNVPVMDTTTVPFQWQESSNTGHPASDFYLSTGNYITFATSVDINVVTTEKWERGLVIWSSKVTIGTMYLEAVTNLGFTAVSSDITISTLTANIVGSNGVYKSNDSASIDIANMTNNEIVKISAGAGSSQPVANNFIFMSIEEFIHPDELFFGGLMIRTTRNQSEEKVYISSSGVDTNTGKGPNNPVLTMEMALARCKFYDTNRIIVPDGETVFFDTFSGLTKDANVTIESATVAGATVSCTLSGNNLKSQVLQNCRLVFKDINLVVPNSPGTPATDFKGMFVPSGDTKIIMDGGSVTSPSVNVGLFSEGSGHSGMLNLSLLGCALNVENLSVNGNLAGSGVRYFYGIDSTSTASGNQNWSTEFISV